jgi:hypothetical protein
MSTNMMTEQKNYTLGMTEVEARQVAEIRGKMVLARQFPRDPNEALSRILAECENVKLAEVAMYSFPRGDTEVKGPSIRLAEVVASHWGNFTCGVTELEQRHGESTVKAYAWDLETNYSDEKTFTVPHIRQTKRGNYPLTDPRDIYELVANQGARRKRACIFSVIPAYLTEAATEKCDAVLNDHIKAGDITKIREKMLNEFAKLDENITAEVIAAKMGKDFDKLGSKDIVKLKRLYAAINDGFVKASVAFDLGPHANAPDSTELSENAKKTNEILFGGGEKAPARTKLLKAEPSAEEPPETIPTDDTESGEQSIPDDELPDFMKPAEEAQAGE